MSAPMMRCGCAASGTNTATGAPVCVVHVGLLASAEIVDDAPPTLEGRMATCGGSRPVPSSPSLAFFVSRPNRETDEYYCGCAGWN